MEYNYKMSQRQLAAYLEASGVLKSPLIKRAFERIDRADFVPKSQKPYVLEDPPLPIGYGQTNSQPYTVAFMLELLEPTAGQKILDVGSGSGWTTALLAEITGTSGRVFGVELIPDLVSFGRANLNKYKFTHASIVKAQPGILGLPAKAPYERILTSAAGDKIATDLIKQLSAPGILIQPVKSAIIKVIKDKNNHTSQEIYEGFAFVPLI